MGVPMDQVLNHAISAFQDLKFRDQVEGFVNINIDTFAAVCFDGSHPIEWTLQYKKYKQLHEDQLVRAIQECGADTSEFMEYMQQCSTHYGHDAGFQQLMTALTASQDYNVFLEQMFAAVRDNWEPEPEAAPPPPNYQLHNVDLTVPGGYGPGQVMQIQYLGYSHPVAVPDWAGPGSAMRC